MQPKNHKWLIVAASLVAILALTYLFQDCHVRELRKVEDSLHVHQRAFDSLRAVVANSKEQSALFDSITKANIPIIKQAVTNYYTVKSPNFSVIDSAFKDSSYRFLLEVANR